MYNNCNQNNCAPIVLTPGPQGIEGATGPTGPVGIDGVDGINIGNNFIALQLQDTDFLINVTPDYVSLPYLEIASQQGNDVIAIPDPITNEYTEVTLTANHTYLIAFNTNGLEHGSAYSIAYRVLVNGASIPDIDTDSDYAWLSNTDNLNHVWLYTATTNTTIEYQISPNNNGDIGLSGIYLTIITLV